MASSSDPPDPDWSARFRAPLPRSFYDRPVARVALELLGQVIVRRTLAGWRAGRIVETEAYGAHDPASHSRGGPTARNRSMFAGPGTLYVYRIHQVHCANAVTRPGEAVLLRAVEPLAGPWVNPSGPGRLCRDLALTRAQDGTDLVQGEVRVVASPWNGKRVRGPRIGIRRAVAVPWRFASGDSPWVSRPRPPRWRGPRGKPTYLSLAQS
ncbi:MAG: DNA-3-methyladenine glycosylase [Thermoplasmata archaeon]|nr:DNA-3-methyladenine glycosylase [Thermoplasmata archaeon]